MNRIQSISLSVSGLMSLVLVLGLGIARPTTQVWILAVVLGTCWWLLHRQWYGFLRHDT
jgi:hypothetical protein